MSTQPPDPRTESEATPEQVLATPPSSMDIGPAIAPSRAPRGGLPMLSYVLAAVILLGGGFLGGYLVGHHSASSSSRFAFPGGGAFPSGGGFPSGGNTGVQGPGGGGVTFGTVTRVDGDTVYVKRSDGTTIAVTTSSSTRIQVSKSGSLADLSPGSTVVVQGSSSGQGSIAARSITEGGGFPPIGTASVPPPVGSTGG